MTERKEGIVETVKDTGASLSKAVTGAVEAVTAYLTPTKRKPEVPKKTRHSRSDTEQSGGHPTAQEDHCEKEPGGSEYETADCCP